MMCDKKRHWENIYKTKSQDEVSWTENKPETSLKLIKETQLDKNSKVIDIGAGDSKLVDFLLDAGYKNISVLDISDKAIDRAKKRLGTKAKEVTWIVSDILDFDPDTTYDIWHDRAAFHFLTSQKYIDRYKELVNRAVNKIMIVGAFSTNGPKKCSGLKIQQYSEETLAKLFLPKFEKTRCLLKDHTTPFGTKQNFLFCSFKWKINNSF